MMIIYAIITLGVLIFVHELGHFLIAKLFNVKVEKFSLGFGPKLFGKQYGETEYLVSAFPLGGYVKMFGEGDFVENGKNNEKSEADGSETEPAPAPTFTEEEKQRSFAHKPPLARIAIVMAGPVFNLIFAWVAFIILCTMGVPTYTGKIGEVMKDKPAARAGVLKNDVITSINGKVVAQWEDVSDRISENKGQPVALTVKRGNQELQFTITPEPRVTKNIFGEKVNGYAIGVVMSGESVTKYYTPLQAIGKGTTQTIKVIELTIMSLVKMAQRVIPLDTVGGPIMIVKMAGEQASAGGASFLAFMALLSINLGILNLLPVPILDGGHLFFYFWELVFRRPVKREVREYAQQIGLALLLGLMVLAFYNDIVRYFMKQG